MSLRIEGSIRATTINGASSQDRSQGSNAAPAIMPNAVDALAASGDVGGMIASMLLESAKYARETAKALKEAASAAEDAAAANKIDHMKSAANARLIAGIGQGAGEIGEGLAAGGGTFLHNAPLHDVAPAMKGGGDCVNAGFGWSASHEDVETAKAEREMSQAKRNIETAADVDKDATDLLRRAMGHYADYVRARDDASKAALFRA